MSSQRMKIYPQIDVDLKFQNCGSSWLMVLTGKEENIELVFNGLWNYGATNVSIQRADGTNYNGLDYVDANKTTATFWSSPEKMYKFFYNSHLIACQQESCSESAHVVARMRMEQLRQETISFRNFNQTPFISAFEIGTMKAERPDDNYKEKALMFSQKKSGEKTIDKD